MRYVVSTAIAVFIGTTAFAQTNAPIVYPNQGQSTEQQATDESECRAWAQQQTGFTGQAPMQMTQAAPRGQIVGGAARGAAVGAVGGAIGDDTGKGAAIGAGVGATAGLLRRGRASRQQAAANQQSQAAYQASLDQYFRAFGVCMSGRGYSVS